MNDIKNPFFSILTVCKNSQDTIFNTFESLLLQNFTNFEYIVIDGMSSDGTVDIIKKYSGVFVNKNINFSWISEKDSGIYDAFNKGIAKCSGKYIGIINSDDTYDKDALLNMYNAICKNPGYDVYHGLLRCLCKNEVMLIIGKNAKRLESGMIQHPTCFVDRNVYKKYGKFSLKYKYVSDYEFMLRIKKANCKFYLVENIIANYDENGASNCYESQFEVLRLDYEYRLSPLYILIGKYIKLFILKLINRKKEIY